MPAMGKQKGEKYIKTWQMEPLPIAQLAGLTPSHIGMEFFDDRIENIDYDAPTDVVAITVETYTAKRAYEISEVYRRKGIKVIMGGYHATLLPDEVSGHADAVVVGEAENVWPAIIQDIERGDLKKIYKKDQKPSLAGYGPNRKIFQDKKYLPIKLVETARGCKFSCKFCSISSFYGSTYRARPINEVVDEIRGLQSKIIFFIDDNIYADRARSIAFFIALVPLRIRWIGQISILAAHDGELLDLMKKSGCIGVLIGFESLSVKSLEQMNKTWNQKASSYSGSLREFRKRGMIIYATFLFGCDDDDLDLMEETYRFAVKERFFLVAFNHLVPFPGTPLYESLEKQGRLLHYKWWLSDSYKFGDVAFKPNKIGEKELSEKCYLYRKKFYSTKTIIDRAFDFRSNCQNLYFASNYLLLNLLFKKEVSQRKGYRLGEKKYE